jgi:hypothetical protein
MSSIHEWFEETFFTTVYRAIIVSRWDLINAFFHYNQMNIGSVISFLENKKHIFNQLGVSSLCYMHRIHMYIECKGHPILYLTRHAFEYKDKIITPYFWPPIQLCEETNTLITDIYKYDLPKCMKKDDTHVHIFIDIPMKYIPHITLDKYNDISIVCNST